MTANHNLCADDYLDLLQQIAEIRHKILIKANVKHITKDALVNEGYIGLVQAVDRFNPELGKEFKNFASWQINNAISSFLRKEDVVDHRVRKKLKDMREAIDQLQQKLGREPTEDEIAKGLNMTIESYRKLIAKDILIESIDDPKFIDQFADEYDHDESEGSEDLKKLGKATDHCLKINLNKDEMLIILLKEFRYFTLQDIVNVMGAGYNISKVHRINELAKSKLKFCLEEKGWTIIDVMAIYSHNCY